VGRRHGPRHRRDPAAQGPGRYRVAFYHHGREEALDQEGEVLAAMGPGTPWDEIDKLCAAREGTERYLFRLWWLAPLPEDDETD
jgi:hypothetical protein